MTHQEGTEMAARRHPKGRAKPGSTVTRRVSRGPNTGDTVRFRANRAGTQEPGKLKPRQVIRDVGPKNRSGVPKKKK